MFHSPGQMKDLSQEAQDSLSTAHGQRPRSTASLPSLLDQYLNWLTSSRTRDQNPPQGVTKAGERSYCSSSGSPNQAQHSHLCLQLFLKFRLDPKPETKRTQLHGNPTRIHGAHGEGLTWDSTWGMLLDFMKTTTISQGEPRVSNLREDDFHMSPLCKPVATTVPDEVSLVTWMLSSSGTEHTHQYGSVLALSSLR